MRKGLRALFAILVTGLGAHAACAQGAASAFAVSIERQPLDGALQQLARQCDVQMIFFSRVTEGLNAPAVDGSYTLDAAMEKLLAGSGLTFRVINPQTVEVKPRQARPERGQAAESGSIRDESLAEVVVVGLAQQLVATRIATPLIDIPQTVSIVSREQMRLQGDTTMADALANVPGVTMVKSNRLDPNFYSRGFLIEAFHTDGGAAFHPTIGTSKAVMVSPDLVEFDHVEILRGADGLFGGNAYPGGTVSLVRKRPQRNLAAEISAIAGSWDTQRIELDVTGALAREGALRGRGAAVYAHDGDFSSDRAHIRKKVFAATEYDFTDTSTLTVGGSYQRDDASRFGSGMPLSSNGQDSRLPRRLSLEFDWTRIHERLAGAYLQYRQQIGPAWSLKFNASGQRVREDYGYGYFATTLDSTTAELESSPTAIFTTEPLDHRQGTVDLTLAGTQDWFGWREELVIGADFTRYQIRGAADSYFDFGPPLREPRTFDPADYPDPRGTDSMALGLRTHSRQDHYGMFAALRVYFDDAWSVIGGARLSGDSTDLDFTLGFAPGLELPVSVDLGTNHVVTPYAGLMYSFKQHYSLYASYADIYRSQGFWVRAPGEPMPPERGVNMEAGIKGVWRDGALNGSLAIYRIRQRNIAYPAYPSPYPVVFGEVPDCCFEGKTATSKGVDLELSGELATGWNIGVGYTYNENELPEGGPLTPFAPRNLFKLWTNARLPGVFSRWQGGGYLTAQSKTTQPNPGAYCPAPTYQCLPATVVQPSYAVLNLRAAFDVNRNWQVGLNVDNVFDKVYYESIGEQTLRAWYGSPRQWALRMQGRF